MSEIQTNTPEDNKFLKRAAATVAGLGLVGTGAWAVGSNIQNEHNNEIAQETADSRQLDLKNFELSVESAVNSTYDKSQVIGEINVTQDSNLIDPALSIVESSLGSDAYNNIKSRIYSPLLRSAETQNPQPGESYSVVSVDINPAQADGNEFIVVKNETTNELEN